VDRDLRRVCFRRVLAACFCACLAVVAACTAPPKPKPTIKAAFDITIKDPLLKRLTEVTSKADIYAVGVLKAGAYTVNGSELRIQKNTKFELQLSLPIDNPAIISTREATGTLSTTTPLVCKGVPLPQKIELQRGTVTGELDLSRMMGAFIFSMLEDQLDSKKDNDIRQIIDDMSIKSATLEVRPGSFCKIGKKLVHLGAGSVVRMQDVTVTGDLDYHGKCVADFRFLDGCKWIGEKVDIDFNGGAGLFNLDAKRDDGVVTLTLLDNTSRVKMTDCTFKFGKNKRSTAHSDVCDMLMNKLVWQKQEGAEHPSLHLDTAMQLTKTTVDVKTDAHETNAVFPGTVPATLAVDIDASGRSTKFATDKAETASNGRITIMRPTTRISLWLDNATLGPISLDKSGDLRFTFPHGTASVRQLDWGSEGKTFHLVTAGSSTLELPEGMDLSLSKLPGGTKLQLPMKVRLGEAELSGGANGKKLKLSKLNGDLLITVDGDCKITSNLDLAIDRSSLLGDHKADVAAKGFSLESRKGEALMHINSCAVVIADQALRQAICVQVPKERTFEINKEFDQRKWRYRNAVIETVHVHDLSVDDLAHQSKNSVSFTVSGDVECDGTVDKVGLLSMNKDDAKTKTCPWKATAEDVVGKGTVSYKLIPHDSLASSVLDYELKMELPIPDNVELDWSQVSHSLLQGIERKAIIGHLKKLTVPIDYKGTLKICKESDTQWNGLKISKLAVKPFGNDTRLEFTADAVF
jgi:hypothetical protein